MRKQPMKGVVIDVREKGRMKYPLKGYGYTRADQDGYNADGPEVVSAIAHKEEEFFAACAELLDAKPLKTEDIDSADIRIHSAED